MTTEERHAKLRAALEPLGRGETIDGKPIDLAKITAEAQVSARAFARKMAVGQTRTRRKLQGIRFVG